MKSVHKIPKRVLGYKIKTKTQILLSLVFPACLEFLLYLLQTLFDFAVAIQHLYDKNILYFGLTLTFIVLPSVFYFIIVIISPLQWPDAESKQRTKFFLKLFANCIFFPFVAVFRFSWRIFWSVEAVFVSNEKLQRRKCISNALQNSSFELYHFAQAYAQSAPQIILQMYILLMDIIYQRNFETSTLQGLSVIFSFANMAMITVSFQRFESQKIIGRNYPWSTEKQVLLRRQTLRQARRQSHRNKITKSSEPASFPENEVILQKFNSIHRASSPQQETVNSVMKVNQTNNSSLEELVAKNKTDDEKLYDFQSIDEKAVDDCLEHFSIGENDCVDGSGPESNRLMNDEIDFDRAPDVPAPLPPQASAVPLRFLNPMKKLSSFRDSAEMYIVKHVPRPPPVMVKHITQKTEHEKNKDLEMNQSSRNQEISNADAVDFFMPGRMKIINGIEEDDFIGKLISFFGWFLFIFMRMFSLSAFATFYPEEMFYTLTAHYILMLIGLACETRLQQNMKRIGFYIFLAYIYIFVLIEFKIKFKYPKRWYILYFTLALTENFVMTLVWYEFAEFSSWWFEYLFISIMVAGGLNLVCMVLYYRLLKPDNVVLLGQS